MEPLDQILWETDLHAISHIALQNSGNIETLPSDEIRKWIKDTIQYGHAQAHPNSSLDPSLSKWNHKVFVRNANFRSEISTP